MIKSQVLSASTLEPGDEQRPEMHYSNCRLPVERRQHQAFRILHRKWLRNFSSWQAPSERLSHYIEYVKGVVSTEILHTVLLLLCTCSTDQAQGTLAVQFCHDSFFSDECVDLGRMSSDGVDTFSSQYLSWSCDLKLWSLLLHRWSRLSAVFCDFRAVSD